MSGDLIFRPASAAAGPAPAHTQAEPPLCDVSLPVPLDQLFTYFLPENLRQRAQAGCRVLVPFGKRKLSGVILRAHDEFPTVPVKPILSY